LEWIDQRWVAAELFHGVAHGGQVDYAGDTGEILQQDAAGAESDFGVGLRLAGRFLGTPRGKCSDFFFLYVAAIFGAQQVLQENTEGKGQVLGGDACFVERVEAVDFVLFFANFEGRAAIETVQRHDGLP
jgi:hypothetical protein